MNVIVFLVLLFGVCAYSIRCGGTPERVVGALFLAAATVSMFSYRGAGVRYHTIEVRVLLIDALLLIALVAVALRADRFWPICMCSIQLTTLCGHLAKAMYPALLSHPYQIVIVTQSYLTLALLAVATTRQVRRARGGYARGRSEACCALRSARRLENWPTS